MTTTAIAPTNIAVVKYWGKNRNWERYHIPNKSSFSITVGGLYTKTTVTAEKSTGGERKVEFVLNGRIITPEMKEYEYVGKLLGKLGELYPHINQYDIHIISENNFPTAAGFASSASGFAALLKALVKELAEEIVELREFLDDDKKLSVLARLGSGSATRSIPRDGGFVLWRRGISPFAEETPENVSEERLREIIFSSYAETLFPPDHWPGFRIIYTQVDEGGEKEVKSRVGMRETVKSDPFYYPWVEYDEKILLPEVIRAVKEKDWELFAKLAIQASNGLHAQTLMTYPPITYLNDTSHLIMHTIHNLNENEIKAAYTFDAGPNAVVFTLEEYVDEVARVLEEIVGKDNIFITKPGRGPYYTEDHLQ